MDLSTLNPASLLPEMILAATGLLLLVVNAIWRGRADASLPLLAGLGTLAGLVFSLFPVTRESGYFGSVVSDPLAIAGRTGVLAALLLLLLGGGSYLRKRALPLAETLGLACFSAVGMLALASAGDLITVFLAVETLSLALYALAGILGQRGESRSAALTYFLTGSFASAFLLFGMALLFAASGGLEIAGLGAGVARAGGGAEWIALGGTVLLMTGFLFKVGAVPFHSWVPEVYGGSPTWVSAWMSTGAKVAAFAGFGRLLLALAPQSAAWGPVLGVTAAATMVLGNFSALAQTNVKRMLAFSAVAHAGYLLLGLLAVGHAGESLEAVLFYLLPYALLNVPLFLIAAHVSRAGGGRYQLDDYKGLARRAPLLAALLATLLLGLAGIPPLAGFLGKLFVFSAAIRAGQTPLAVLGVLTSVVGVYYYLRLVVLSYFHDSQDSTPLECDRGLTLASGLAALAVLVLGVWPELWLRVTQGIGL
jgi:NADH-quinone oxidoreductase subunit N